MKLHSVPLPMKLLNRETLPQCVEQLKACGVDRVFLGMFGYVYTSQSV